MEPVTSLKPFPTPPSPEQVEDLIARATHHPLGIAFLKEGALESVAAIFGVHAFVVDEARDKLE